MQLEVIPQCIRFHPQMKGISTQKLLVIGGVVYVPGVCSNILRGVVSKFPCTPPKTNMDIQNSIFERRYI